MDKFGKRTKMERVYLDNAATTCVRDEVIEKMQTETLRLPIALDVVQKRPLKQPEKPSPNI